MEASQRRSKDGSQETGPGALTVLRGEGRGVKEGGVGPGMFQELAKAAASLGLCSRRASR